jgi:hypothetical protein
MKSEKHEFTLQEVLQGHATKIKNKDYFKTSDYLNPFIDRMSKYTNDFEIRVKIADQISYDRNGDIDIDNVVFNRVWLQAILPESDFENHRKSLNLLYALDTRKPIAKIFKNDLNMACLNMCVFNPDCIQVQDIQPEEALDYGFIDQVMEIDSNTNKILTRLQNTILDQSQVFNALGQWVDNSIRFSYNRPYGKVKVSEDIAIEAYKNLYINDESEYFCGKDSTNYFNIYNSFTDIICNDKDKDIVNKFEKVYLVSKILGIF